MRFHVNVWVEYAVLKCDTVDAKLKFFSLRQPDSGGSSAGAEFLPRTREHEAAGADRPSSGEAPHHVSGGTWPSVLWQALTQSSECCKGQLTLESLFILRSMQDTLKQPAQRNQNLR